jgi:hypothetical protein
VSLKVDGEMVDSDGEIPFNLSLTNLAEQRNALSEARDQSAAITTETPSIIIPQAIEEPVGPPGRGGAGGNRDRRTR